MSPSDLGTVMPEHQIHEFVSQLIFGKPFSEVNRALDWPIKYLGSEHRRLFHDSLSAVVIGGIVTLSVFGSAAALIHIIVDGICSEHRDVERVLRALARSANS